MKNFNITENDDQIKSADYIMGVMGSVSKKIEYPYFSSTVSINEMCDRLISTGPGVYFFHDLRGIHYVGETSDLRLRFLSHLKKGKNKKLSKVISSAFGVMNFSWVKTSSKMEALIYQKKWIRLFKPKCNEIFYKNN
jgi:excinuclease UvrABC nuclease subunit